jgi:hypothetical protein
VHEATGLGAWAAGSATFMPALAKAIPNYIECVTIYVDANETGRRVAWPGCAQSLLNARVLERHHGIISEADKGTSPLETWPHLELKPFIQHVVQENVREAR